MVPNDSQTTRYTEIQSSVYLMRELTLLSIDIFLRLSSLGIKTYFYQIV